MAHKGRIIVLNLFLKNTSYNIFAANIQQYPESCFSIWPIFFPFSSIIPSEEKEQIYYNVIVEGTDGQGVTTFWKMILKA